MGLYDSFKLGREAATESTQSTIQGAVKRQTDKITQANADRQYGLNERQIGVQEEQLKISQQNADLKEQELSQQAERHSWDLVMTLSDKDPELAQKFYNESGMQLKYGGAKFSKGLVKSPDGTILKYDADGGLQPIYTPYRRKNEIIEMAEHIFPNDRAQQTQWIKDTIENKYDRVSGGVPKLVYGTDQLGNKTVSTFNPTTQTFSDPIIIGQDNPMVQKVTRELLSEKTSLQSQVTSIYKSLAGGDTNAMAQMIAAFSGVAPIQGESDESIKTKLRAIAESMEDRSREITEQLDAWREERVQPEQNTKPQSTTTKGQQDTVAPATAKSALNATSRSKLDAIKAATSGSK